MPGSAAMQGPSQALSGTAVEGSLGTSATLSGILGSAATGAAIGGFLNKKNPTAGMIGGAVGGVAGGMMIGAQIGSVVPGIGTVIGAVVGGLGSRLFGGGKPATNAVVSAGNISPDGKISNIRVTGSKNPGQFAEFGNENVNAMQNITTAAARDLGIKFSPFQVESGISTRHGGAYMRIEGQNPQGITVNDTGQMFYDYTNKDSTKDLQYKALEALAKNSGYTDTAKLKEWFDSGSSTNFASGAGNTLKLAKPKENTSFKDFVANFKSTQNANAA
jgi:hypothetical protein